MTVVEKKFGVVSGAVWGVIAIGCVSRGAAAWQSPSAWFVFVALGVAIGVVSTRALRGFRPSGLIGLAGTALATLLATVGAFATALALLGLVKAGFAGFAAPSMFIGLIYAPLIWWWGLFANGLVVVLWPAAILTHWLLIRLRTASSLASSPAHEPDGGQLLWHHPGSRAPRVMRRPLG